MNERDTVNSRLIDFLSDNFKDIACEAKFVNVNKKKSIRFDDVKEHQRTGLLDAKSGFFYKIPDTGGSRKFSTKRPFDLCYIKSEESYVVVLIWEAYKYLKCIFVRIEDWLEAESKATRKSIKIKELKKIGTIYEIPSVKEVLRKKK